MQPRHQPVLLLPHVVRHAEGRVHVRQEGRVTEEPLEHARVSSAAVPAEVMVVYRNVVHHQLQHSQHYIFESVRREQ